MNFACYYWSLRNLYNIISFFNDCYLLNYISLFVFSNNLQYLLSYLNDLWSNSFNLYNFFDLNFNLFVVFYKCSNLNQFLSNYISWNLSLNNNWCRNLNWNNDLFNTWNSSLKMNWNSFLMDIILNNNFLNDIWFRFNNLHPLCLNSNNLFC